MRDAPSRFVLAASVALTVPVGCGEQRSEPAAPLRDARVAPSDTSPRSPPAKPCPALHIEVPPLTVFSKHDAAIPDVVDFGRGLDPLFEKLARRARGTPNTTVRIGVYGDSNLANDRTLGNVRRQLQPSYGDGGHGWVSFGKPWGWYKHMDVDHGTTGAWTSFNLSSSHAPDYFYGFAGTAAESSDVGATAWVATARAGAPVGGDVSSFDLFYLARPHGGTFEVALDDDAVVHETIETTAAAPELRVAHYTVANGPHRLTVTVRGGRIRVFGVALERDAGGIVIDSLGVGSLNPWLLDTMDHPMSAVGLARRNYDLIVETSGSNMCASKWINNLLGTWRGALPHAAVLLWSPPDAARFGTWTSDPLMRTCAAEKRTVAQTNAIAFWDLYAALGGYGSMPKWLLDSRTESWAEPDGLHLGPRLNKYIAERFVHALLAELARRVKDNPRLGCDDPPPT